MEGAEAIPALVRRFPDMELATDRPDWNGRMVLRGSTACPSPSASRREGFRTLTVAFSAAYAAEEEAARISALGASGAGPLGRCA